MKLEFLLLADSAVSAKDGVFSALNCGLDCFRCRAFPARKSSLVAIARILFDPDEMDRPHDFLLELIGPGGNRLDPAIPVTVTPIPYARHPDRPNHMTVALTVYSLSFSEAGFHTFRFSSGERVLGESPFEVFQSEGIP